MARKKPNVVVAVIFPTPRGIQIIGRDPEGKIVYESPFMYRSRRKAREAVYNRWPNAKVTFDIT